MNEYLVIANLEPHRDDLLREAEQARLAARLHDPHVWRHRVGRALIRLGRRMAAEPAFAPGKPRLRLVREADEPRPRTA